MNVYLPSFYCLSLDDYFYQKTFFRNYNLHMRTVKRVYECAEHRSNTQKFETQ